MLSTGIYRTQFRNSQLRTRVILLTCGLSPVHLIVRGCGRVLARAGNTAVIISKRDHLGQATRIPAFSTEACRVSCADVITKILMSKGQERTRQRQKLHSSNVPTKQDVICINLTLCDEEAQVFVVIDFSLSCSSTPDSVASVQSRDFYTFLTGHSCFIDGSQM